MAIVLILLGLAWNEVDTPAPRAGSALDVQFEFERASWDEVLQWLASKNGLQLAMESPPPGRFSYFDPKKYTPAEAMALLREVLALRGVTLVEREGLLIVVRLVDDVVWDLTPFVPASLLQEESGSRFVMSILPVHTLQPSKVAPELERMLSPRGRLVPADAARRLVVWDTVAVISHIIKILGQIDSPDTKTQATFRAFGLQHITAAEALVVIREAVGMTAPAEEPPLVDFQQMGRDLGNRQMLQSFLPGFSLGGIVPDAPRDPVPTRIGIDRRLNQLLVQAEPTIIHAIDRIVKQIDQPMPDAEPDTQLTVHTYRVGTDEGAAFAERLKQLFAHQGDWRFSGYADHVVVHATAEGHQQIQGILSQIRQATTTVAVLPVEQNTAKELATLLTRLFGEQDDNAPSIVASPDGSQLLVRGTASQIEMVKSSLPLPVSRVAPKVDVHRLR